MRSFTKKQFNRFLLISFILHLLIFVLVGFYREPVKQVQIEFRVKSLKKIGGAAPKKKINNQRDRTTTKKAGSRKKSTSKNKTKKNRSTASKTKAKTVKKAVKPQLVRNNSTRRRRTSTSSSSPQPLNPLTLNKSRYKTRTFSTKSSRSLSSDQGGGGSTSSASDFDDIPSESGGGGVDDDFSDRYGHAGKSAKGGSASGSQSKNSGGKSGSNNLSGANFSWNGKSSRSLISSGKLVMPRTLKHRGIQAKVDIKFKVDASGRPFGVELMTSSGYTELDNEVKRYTRTFRFDRVKGKDVYEAVFTQIFRP